MPSNTDQVVILGDTNIAYILYFFLSDGIIPRQNISLKTGEKLKFHPIVEEEASIHQTAYITLKELNIASGDVPKFFGPIGEETIQKILDFILENLADDLNEVDTESRKFAAKRALYEEERRKLQGNWKKNGTQGNKVSSRPSDQDYSVLFSAQTQKRKIATNDEILLAVAGEFLGEDDTYKAEDIVNDFFCGNPDLKFLIEKTSETLDAIGITFSLARALKT